MCFYPSSRAQVSCRRTLPPPRSCCEFFNKINLHLPLASMGTQSWAQDDPKCSEGAEKKSRSSFLGAKSVTFTGEIDESGPLLKHQQGLCFHHIMKVRAPPFLLRNSLRERTAHRERSFSHFWLSFWRPSGAQGRPRETKRAQKDSQSLPGDT